MIAKRKIPKSKRRYYDFKMPSFPDCRPPNKRKNWIKIERYGNVAEHLGFGYIIIIDIDNVPYCIEGEQVTFNDTIKRKDSHFVDVESTQYVNNSKYNISMHGSYYHGFHYFRTEEQAIEIAEKLYPSFPYEIKQASIYSSNARGIMLDTETHCTCELYIHD
jgi:hypothetical protein